MSDAAHPRAVYAYERGEGVERAFLDTLERGRLHHAWLLTGPEGVGKATFAYRAARRLLGARPDPSRGLLGSAPTDPVCRLVEQGAHPDLMVLERQGEGARARKVISVDEARELPEFFAKSPSMAAWRVAIVDAADDMNVNAANALLKTLEEPPERGVLFLVAHAPARLLTTIRSRCRRLAFPRWPEADVGAFIGRHADVDPETARAIAAMAGGAPGRALRLAAGPALELDAMARQLVEGPIPDDAALLHLADQFRGAEGQGRFELLFERLAEAVRRRAVAQAGGGSPEPWADLWDRLVRLPEEAAAVNLDRADAFYAALGELRRVRAAEAA